MPRGQCLLSRPSLGSAVHRWLVCPRAPQWRCLLALSTFAHLMCFMLRIENLTKPLNAIFAILIEEAILHAVTGAHCKPTNMWPWT